MTATAIKTKTEPSPMYGPPAPSREGEYGLVSVEDARKRLGPISRRLYRHGVERLLRTVDDQAFYRGLGGIVMRHAHVETPEAVAPYVPPRNRRQKRVEKRAIQLAEGLHRSEQAINQSDADVNYLSIITKKQPANKIWLAEQKRKLKEEKKHGTIDPFTYEHEVEELHHLKVGHSGHKINRRLKPGEKPLISRSKRYVREVGRSEGFRAELDRITKRKSYERKINRKKKSLPRKLVRMENRRIVDKDALHRAKRINDAHKHPQVPYRKAGKITYLTEPRYGFRGRVAGARAAWHKHMEERTSQLTDELSATARADDDEAQYNIAQLKQKQTKRVRQYRRARLQQLRAKRKPVKITVDQSQIM